MRILDHLNNTLLSATKLSPNNVSIFEVNSWQAIIDFLNLFCF